MTAQKQQYLDHIRRNTAYPTYRIVVDIIAFLLSYLGAGLIALSALVRGFGTMRHDLVTGVVVLLGGVISCGLIFVLGRVYKETSSMLADIADCMTETSR